MLPREAHTTIESRLGDIITGLLLGGPSQPPTPLSFCGKSFDHNVIYLVEAIKNTILVFQGL